MDTQSLVGNEGGFKSSRLFVVSGIILISVFISVLCIGLMVRYEVDTETADDGSVPYWKLELPPEQAVWYEKGIDELRSVVVVEEEQQQHREVKNIVIFVAEGVTGEMLALGRLKEEGGSLQMKDFVWDTFPHVGVLKGACGVGMDCDAFTVATGLFGGIKSMPGLGGVDTRIERLNCHCARNESYHVRSIFKQAKESELRTGFVTSGRVTGPLVAALYAHSSDSQWECDGDVPLALKAECLDVAAQLVKLKEGRDINVIMGGGRQTLVSGVGVTDRSGIDDSVCVSLDGRNLLQEWQTYKMSDNVTAQLLATVEDVDSFNGSDTEYVLGVFGNGDVLRRQGPSLKNMVTKSLDVLSGKGSGYVLLVETALKRAGGQDFRNVLWELEETIKETFAHQGFSPNDSIVVTLFVDLENTAHDILLYATGLKSQLFQGVHDATYLTHAIAYCLKMGIFRPA